MFLNKIYDSIFEYAVIKVVITFDLMQCDNRFSRYGTVYVIFVFCNMLIGG